MFFRRMALLTCVLALATLSTSQAQNYVVQLADIQRSIHENWLSVPTSMDMVVSWNLFEDSASGRVPVETPESFRFRAKCLHFLSEQMIADEAQTTELFASFSGKKAGRRHAVVVELLEDESVMAVSDTAWVVAGRLRANGPDEGTQWHYWIPLNGRLPLSLVGRGYIFDSATNAGKIAFHLIWNFFLTGAVIWLFFCWRYLSLSHVFPLSGRINIGRSFDQLYDSGIAREFENIVDQWREVTESANDHIRDGLVRSEQNCVDDIAGENVTFWREKGVEGIQKLQGQMQKFLDYPTARIIEAGLENHELGGFRWLEVSKEVDRAIENQASSELEKMRRQSLVDWLWNLGTLSPLVGLFGTATGISSAFGQLTQLRSDITQTTLVRNLAGGIFEALWTTIMGLFVGILMMLLYYYYDNKLKWIYAKWEEIYVYVTRKL